MRGILSQNYWKVFLLMILFVCLPYVLFLLIAVLIAALIEVGLVFSGSDLLTIIYYFVISCFAYLILPIVSIPLWYGYNWCILSFSRQQDISVKAILEPYTTAKKFWKTIGNVIMVGIFICLWMLLLIVPGIIKVFSYAMVPYILKDEPNIGVIKAITKSRKIMDGNKWRLFKLYFSFIGWYLLVILTLGLALFWVAPYVQVATACFYNEIRRQYDEKQTIYQEF